MYKQPTTWLLQEKKPHFFFSITSIYYSNIENLNKMVIRLFFQVTQTCILTAKFSPTETCIPAADTILLREIIIPYL